MEILMHRSGIIKENTKVRQADTAQETKWGGGETSRVLRWKEPGNYEYLAWAAKSKIV